jgi:5-formyltetrahydrofolate cyclo-ligase
MPGSIMKAQIRNRIWGLLTRAGVALLPGAYGSTPQFHGVRKLVTHLRGLEQWRRAGRVLVLGEAVLARVRQAAVAEGKVLVVPDLTRSGDWIVEIDPGVMNADEAQGAAATGAFAGDPLPRGARLLRGHDLAPVDLMIIGAVGVDRHGVRIGKGAGEADIVYALGRARGFLAATTPVAVLIHELQLLEEPAAREPTDLPVDLIITPNGAQTVRSLHIRPKGLDPAMITPDRLDAFPGLRGILEREGIELSSHHS